MDNGRAAPSHHLREGAAGVNVGAGGIRAMAAAGCGVLDRQHRCYGSYALDGAAHGGDAGHRGAADGVPVRG